MTDFIKKRHFKRALVSQPFFIWHSLKDASKTELDEDEFEDEESMIDLIWKVDEIDEQVEETANQKIARTFKLIDEYLMSQLKDKHDTVFLKGSVEERIAMTNDLLSSGKMIVNPAFLYRNAIAEPFAFDTKSKEIINIKYSMTHSIKDFYNYFFDYSVISRVTEVRDCILYLPYDKNYKKGEIFLMKANYASFKSKQKQDDIFGVDKNGIEKEVAYLYKHLSEGRAAKEFIYNPRAKKQKPEKIYFEFDDFDNYLDRIEEAREVTEPIMDITKDVTRFGTNSEINELMEHFGSLLSGYSGKVFRKIEIPTDILFSQDMSEIDGLLSQLSLVWANLAEAVKRGTSLIDRSRLHSYHQIRDAKIVVWYDFEGFSLPISPMDLVKPYRQVAFQVSTIITKDNKEVEKENIVIDPASITSEDFFTIIKSIYRKDAEKYVVYNKGYELARLNEMKQILELENHKDLLQFSEMLQAIVDNTVDLFDLFKINSPNIVPPILLFDQKARASIKNVEKHITVNNIDLPRKITPYKELEVKNGAAAMEVAINRALGIIGDNEWKIRAEELKKYCENDVRAMIMVYDYVDKVAGGK